MGRWLSRNIARWDRASLFRRQRCAVIVLIILAVLLAPYVWPFLYNFGDWVRQTNPWSEQYRVQQDFVSTRDELDCLYGRTPPPTNVIATDAEPIPNHVHFIFGLSNPHEDPGVGTFNFISYLAVRSAAVGMRADRISLHYTYLADPPAPEPNHDPFSNRWVHRLKDDITLVYHSPQEMDALKNQPGAHWQAAHISDILRLKVLREQGGIYLDIDAFGLRPFTDLLRSPRDIIMGHEGGNRGGLCNAIMVARKNSTFIDRWTAEYSNVDLSREWNFHSVILPKKLQLQNPDDICALPPSTFFWPTWTWHHILWMHEPLTRQQARQWAAEIDHNGGSLFGEQLAYHAWSQMAWDRFLSKLTPEVVRTRDTRFNLLVRRFLHDDVGAVWQ
ncbi:putative glycosyl transferase [Rosellinia necatrix]|uniref:Putative glycosyl transferase n=1 Tax=Rosellinia necatrix TaxID=77044 RepID=A0A1W2TXB2_ROSNE|nr:putative glycosyl transferase [Rosellinia necatrix]